MIYIYFISSELESNNVRSVKMGQSILPGRVYQKLLSTVQYISGKLANEANIVIYILLIQNFPHCLYHSNVLKVKQSEGVDF
jgi:hypothetical protein